jgi:beta-glucosidase/6-phospho-beta-glucosidase/beta-galactosidase
VGHSVLVAHAHVSAFYRKKYPHGLIGITLNADWAEPFDSSPESEFYQLSVN